MDVVDVYSDSLQLLLSPFTATLVFGEAAPVGPGSPQVPKPVATVRMSLEHAKVVAIILRRQIKQYEEQLGQPIPLLPQVYQQLGLSAHEDW